MSLNPVIPAKRRRTGLGQDAKFIETNAPIPSKGDLTQLNFNTEQKHMAILTGYNLTLDANSQIGKELIEAA